MYCSVSFAQTLIKGYLGFLMEIIAQILYLLAAVYFAVSCFKIFASISFVTVSKDI